MKEHKMKMILSDCDGVCLDWGTQFHKWMAFHGHVRVDFDPFVYYKEMQYNMDPAEAMVWSDRFNQSGWIMDLQPMPDAVPNVSKLHKAGYKFHVITALGVDPYAQKLRQWNLDAVFGTGVVTRLTLTNGSRHGGKVEALSEYRGSGLYWIEDRQKHAEVGLEMGLKSILFSQPHNLDYKVPSGMIRAASWDEICQIVLDS